MSELTEEKESSVCKSVGPRLIWLLTIVLAFSVSVPATKAYAAAPPAPHWEVTVISKPENFKTGTWEETKNEYEAVLMNVGGVETSGSVTVKLKLPEGLTYDGEISTTWPCSPLGGTEVTCTEPSKAVRPGAVETVQFEVNVASSAPQDLVGEVEVSEGGAPSVSRSFANHHSETPPLFGTDEWNAFPSDASGDHDTLAGGRPTLFNSAFATPMVNFFAPGSGEGNSGVGAQRGGVENVKDMVIDLPSGFVGNPTAAPKCPIQVFLSQPFPPDGCPAGSTVGYFTVGASSNLFRNGLIYNLVPEPGYPAEFGFYDTQLNHGIAAQAELAHTNAGYVVRFAASELIKAIAGPYYLHASFFGNPERESGLLGSGAPFLTNPADCSGEPLRTTIHVDTWSDPASVPLDANGGRNYGDADFSAPQWHTAVSESAPVTGCEGLRFDPTIFVNPDESSADSPTGLAVDLSVPQNEEPESPATPPLRDATVALPAGLVVDPSSADGLAGCTEAQIAPDSTDPGSCPAASKLGTATLTTPLIDHQLEGSVYLGAPACSPCTDADASAGRLLKLYIEIDDPSTGVVVKLPGRVAADPSSGRLTATFEENPQLPFEHLELHFKSGSRAPLTTPSTCGEYTATTDLKPWSAPQSGPDATPQARFKVSSGPGGSACPSGEAALPNSPAFEAGTVAPLAGTYSPFVLKVKRENGSQRIASIDTTLPEGLVGKLAGIPYCPDSAIAAASGKGGREEQAHPSCPLTSEVGTVTVGAGSGTPFYVQGHAYLAGPYKGAPLSLEIITSAVAGPFDLGTVAVRTALYVNETTAQIHAVSDPIPSILAGIPLDIRSIALNMNRPQFTLNPTSCDPMTVLGSTTSTLGQTASLRNRFQVGGCKGLAFKPTLKLAFTGQTKRTGYPAVRAVLTQPKGENANLAGATVILPKGMLIANAHINNPCTRVQFNSGALPGEGCPAKSVLGTAKVWTPLLERPEEGKVYFRSNGGERKLPDLAVALRGQIPLQLVGFIDSVGKKGAEVRRVRSRFLNLPDAPVSRFELKLSGGKKGLLQNSKNLCKISDRAKFQLTGQNGKTHDTEPKVQVSCGAGSKGQSKKK